MNNTHTTRLTSFALALLLTVVTNGSMLMSFDSVALNAAAAQGHVAATTVTLDTVTIVGHLS